MIHYSTNWMGPINMEWIRTNGVGWAGGRIDIRGPEDKVGPYGEEVGVPVMDHKSWSLLQDWLDTYQTEEIDYKVLETFQDKTGRKITFWKEGKYLD